MKTKNLLLIIITGLITFNINAQTNVGGTLSSNTTWTIDGSPYNLTNNVGVLPGITLTINPGVQVSGNYDVLVKGNLICNGNSDSIIEFQSTRIMFENTNLSNTEMSYVLFDNAGIQLADESEYNQDNPKNSGTLTMDDCEFKNNAYAKAKGYNTNTFFVINSSKFNNSLIEGYNGETIELNYCEIINTTIYAYPHNEEITVRSCEIRYSGLTLNISSNINIIKSNIYYSLVSSYFDGFNVQIDSSIILQSLLRLNRGELYISNSILDFNPEKIQNRTVGGYIDSINNVFRIETRKLDLKNSSIKGLVSGAAIKLTPHYDFNSNITKSSISFVESAINILREGCTISNSNFNQVNNYFIINESSDNIIATNNWWGTSNGSIISNKIYDTFDDINAGQVDYSNYLSSPDTAAPMSVPIQVYKSLSENGIILYWDSNLESDLAGYKIHYNSIDEFTYANSIDVGNDTIYEVPGLNLSDTIVVTAYDNKADGVNDLFEGHESWYSQQAQAKSGINLISGSLYCGNDSVVYFVSVESNYQPDNNYIVAISDIEGSFDSSNQIVSVNEWSSSTIKCSLPDTLEYGKNYKLYLKSTNPEMLLASNTVMKSPIPTAEFSLDTNKLCGTDTVLISYTGTGTTNANYNWNFSNGNIISGTGQGDYRINWISPGLKNISLSVEENGCTSTLYSHNIKLYQPNSSFLLENVVCENQNTSIEFNGVASDSASFDWDFDGANIVSDSNESYLVNWDILGVKDVSLIINDNGCLSSQTIQPIEHNPIPTPTFTAPEKVCYYEPANIEYLGTATSSANYNWNFNNGSILSGTGEGPYEITWGNSGIKTISLNVAENGCSSDTIVSLSVNQQTQPISICMVSVDSSNHNMIVWEQPIDNAYDSIVIYKETSQSDVYEKIGTHSSIDASVFVDENSNPSQNPSRYKISILDSCGYETSQSDYHKTIHLTINSGINGAWNLIWDGYEGFSYSTYNIYRGTTDGNMLKIAEQASNTFTYTDLIPPAGTVYYQLEVENPNSCSISNLKSSNNYYASTRSNIVNSSQVSSINDFSFEGIEIYPNPTNDKIYVKTIISDDYAMEILSLDGKLMINYQNIQNNREFDISSLKPGLYLLKLTNNKKSMNMKLIKR